MIDTRQLRAARGLLGWSQADLAEKSGVSHPTIQRIEKAGPGRSAVATLDAIEKALTSAGVIFISENGDGVGVRLKKVMPDDPN